MKSIQVVAAIIRNEAEGKILATQRGYGDFAGGWEFPGGKVEPGETPEQAVVREIREELDAQVEVERFVTTVDYDYPNFHLTMHCYLAHVASGQVKLLEHSAARWVDGADAGQLDWLPADVGLVEELRAQGVV